MTTKPTTPYFFFALWTIAIILGVVAGIAWVLGVTRSEFDPAKPAIEGFANLAGSGAWTSLLAALLAGAIIECLEAIAARRA